MSTLPKDPVMLLSFTNMKLRDECPDLTVFAKDMKFPAKNYVSVLQELIITIRNRVTSLNNYFTKSGIFFASR